ncbi:YesL family protein [Gracilibacillus phocaeensis]|nr:DUF624 domain-containing protein [Gracilibacillus phocaeensis]
MVASGPFKLIYVCCEWVMRLVYINVLWVLFTLVGGIILGIYPATAATFTVVKQWLREEDVSIFRTFFQSYKSQFLRANLAGLILTVTGALIVINFQLVHLENQTAHFLFLMIMFVIACFFVVTLIYIFPLMADYSLSLKDYFTQAILIGIATPFRTLMIVAFLFGTTYIFLLLSTLLVLFGVSSVCLTIAYFTSRSVRKIEGKAAKYRKAQCV